MIHDGIYVQRFILGERDKVIDFKDEECITIDNTGKECLVKYKRYFDMPNDGFVIYTNNHKNSIYKFNIITPKFKKSSDNNTMVPDMVETVERLPKLSQDSMLTVVIKRKHGESKLYDKLSNVTNKSIFDNVTNLYLLYKYNNRISENNLKIIELSRSKLDSCLLQMTDGGYTTDVIYTVEDINTIQNYFYRFGISKIFDINSNLKLLLPSDLSIKNIFGYIDYKLGSTVKGDA